MESLEPKKHLTIEEQALAEVGQNKPLLADDDVAEEDQDAFPDAIPKKGADAAVEAPLAAAEAGTVKAKKPKKAKRAKSPKRDTAKGDQSSKR